MHRRSVVKNIPCHRPSHLSETGSQAAMKVQGMLSVSFMAALPTSECMAPLLLCFWPRWDGSTWFVSAAQRCAPPELPCCFPASHYLGGRETLFNVVVG